MSRPLTSQSAGRKTQNARVAYTIQEAAEKLAVSTKTVTRFIRRGLLPTSKASRKVLISAKAVENFVEATS
jgi:excisionase family DNA binding protein